jgi:hypothetical protein
MAIARQPIAMSYVPVDHNGRLKSAEWNTVFRRTASLARCLHRTSKTRAGTVLSAGTVSPCTDSFLSPPLPAYAPRAASIPIQRCIRHVVWLRRLPPVPQHRLELRWLSRRQSRCWSALLSTLRSAPRRRSGRREQFNQTATDDVIRAVYKEFAAARRRGGLCRKGMARLPPGIVASYRMDRVSAHQIQRIRASI